MSNTVKLVLALTVIIASSYVIPTQALAWTGEAYGRPGYHHGRGHHNNRGHHGHDYARPVHHGHHGGSLGSVVFSLPNGSISIRVGSGHVYYHQGRYFKPHHNRYVIVERPVVIREADNYYTDELTINIPHKNGGYTAVRLIRKDGGFVGPQGEFYPEFPKVEQLKEMYGK